MKTTCITSHKGGRLAMLVAAMISLTLLGCQEDHITIQERDTEYEAAFDGHVMSQTITVSPDGTEVEVFGGLFWLKFPEGTVSEPSEFTVNTFPIDQLEFSDFNMYNKGLSLEGPVPDQKIANVTIRVQYDLSDDNWLKGAPDPDEEQALTIYHVSPNIYAYQRITSIGNCCVDCSCKMIKGCVSFCGFYVVGEN